MRTIKHIHYGLTISGLIILIIVTTGSGVRGATSYSIIASFYRGIEINTEMIVFDPLMLSISFKMLREIPIPPEAEIPAGPVSIPFTAELEFKPLLLMTGNDPELASLERGPVGQMDANVLESLKFTSNIPGVIVDNNDPLVLMAPDETSIKIGNFEYRPNGTLSFANNDLITSPEPASFILLSLGGVLIVIISLWREKQRRRRQ